MNRKAKGTNAERELIHMLLERGWYPIRAAGSGSARYPSPDIMAANGIRRLAIECKTSSDPKRYVTREQIEELRIFSAKFNAEPWLAFKHNTFWYFMALDELISTGKLLLVTEELAKNKGLSVDEACGNKIYTEAIMLTKEVK